MMAWYHLGLSYQPQKKTLPIWQSLLHLFKKLPANTITLLNILAIVITAPCVSEFFLRWRDGHCLCFADQLCRCLPCEENVECLEGNNRVVTDDRQFL